MYAIKMAKRVSKQKKSSMKNNSVSNKAKKKESSSAMEKKVFAVLLIFIALFSLVISFVFFTSHNDYTVADRFDTIEFFYDHCMTNATEGKVLSDFDMRIKDQVAICEAIVFENDVRCTTLASTNPYDLFQEGICQNFTLIPACFESRDVESEACSSVFVEDDKKNLLTIIFDENPDVAECDMLESTSLRSLCSAYILQDESKLCSKYDKEKCQEYEALLMLNAYLKSDMSSCNSFPDMMHRAYCKAAISNDVEACELEVKNLGCRIEAVMLHMRNGGKELDCDSLYDENSKYFCNEIMGNVY